MDGLLILFPAFVLCALLVMTHTYLGLHVLARGIIFVDLALAQMAAFGASVAFLLGKELHGFEGQLYALIAAVAAAVGFAQLRRVKGKTAREVIIGVVYVVSTAAAVLVLSRSVHGTEELKNLLNGSVLWVRWSEIALVAAVYGVIGAFYLVFRKKFQALSRGGEGASLLWEHLFFISFAVIITAAVGLAGILVVFAFLIIPAFSASLLVSSFGARLFLGWAVGLLGALAGLIVAFFADLPVGASLVSVLGVVPVLCAILRPIFGRNPDIA